MVLAREDIKTCMGDVVVKKGTKGKILSYCEGEPLTLVEFDEGICGKNDAWWVLKSQLELIAE